MKKASNIIKGKLNVFTQGCQNWEIIYTYATQVHLPDIQVASPVILLTSPQTHRVEHSGVSRACKLTLVGTCTGNPGECRTQP